MNEGSATNDLIVIAEFGADTFLSFRYCRAQFGPEAACAFADLYLAELDALGSIRRDAA